MHADWRLIALASLPVVGLPLSWLGSGIPIPLIGAARDAFDILGFAVAAIPFVPAPTLLAVGFGFYGLVTTLAGEPSALLTWALLPFLWSLLSFIVSLAAAPFVWGAMVSAGNEIASGRRASLGSALRTAWVLVVPLTRTLLFLSAGLILCAAAGGVSGLLLPALRLPLAIAAELVGAAAGLVCVLVLPLMIIERCDGRTALRTSRQLMRGNLLPAGGALIVVDFVREALHELLPASGAMVAGVAINTALTAYAAGVLVALYRAARGSPDTYVGNRLDVTATSQLA